MIPIQVEGFGNPSSDIVLVGEAPGADEVRAGRPFVGQAGQLLDECLKVAGLFRNDLYITNTIKERPPGNNAGLFIKFKKKSAKDSIAASEDIAIKTESYTAYEERLYEELKNHPVNVVVAFGNIPLYALCRKHSITKWRGSVLWSPFIEKKVIPAFHPASALPFRSPLNRNLIINDLRRAKEQALFPEVRLMERKLKTFPSMVECVEYFHKIKKKKLVAFDIEVMIKLKEISCISFSVSPDDAISIPFVKDGEPYWSEVEEVEIWDMISEVLEDEKIEKVAQNMVFDCTYIYEKYGIITNNVHDTLLAQRLIMTDYPVGLDFIISVHCDGEPYHKDDGKQWMKMVGGSEEQFAIYNCKDSATCLEAYQKQMPLIDTIGNRNSYERQRSLLHPALFSQKRGIRVDQTERRKASAKLGREIIKLDKEFNKVVGYEINMASPKQLCEYFYEKKGAKPVISRSTGRPTTDEKAIRQLVTRGFTEGSIILERRSKAKLKSTYFDARLKDGRLHCSVNLGGTKGSRFSTNAHIFGYGTNMQNLPPQMKKFLLADEGYIGYELDYSQIENKLVAHLAREERLIEAFNNGEDVHSLTASLIYEKPAGEISSVKKSSGIANYSERDIGKRSNHGLNYGMKHITFARNNLLPLKFAKDTRVKYFEAYPNIPKVYWKGIENQLRKDRTLDNGLGRKRVFLGAWGETLLNEAYNWKPQTITGDMLNEFGIKHLYDNYEEAEYLLQVHDSIWLQIPISVGWARHSEILNGLIESMEREIQLDSRTFKCKVNCEGGECFGSMIKLNTDNSLEYKLFMNFG